MCVNQINQCAVVLLCETVYVSDGNLIVNWLFRGSRAGHADQIPLGVQVDMGCAWVKRVCLVIVHFIGF